jgi:hypothetical protein
MPKIQIDVDPSRVHPGRVQIDIRQVINDRPMDPPVYSFNLGPGDAKQFAKLLRDTAARVEDAEFDRVERSRVEPVAVGDGS